MRYRPPRNKWGADFAEDYEKNLEDIERDITGVEEIVEGSKANAEQALTFATEAKGKAESVQEQFNQVVIEGDSSVEAAQARVDAKNVAHPTLKARADSDYNEVTAQLAEITSDEYRNDLIILPLRKSIDERDTYLYTSQNGVDFKKVSDNPMIPDCADPSIIFRNDYFWVISSDYPSGSTHDFKLSRSKNLSNWETFYISVGFRNAGMTTVWAPEWFEDTDGRLYILISAGIGTVTDIDGKSVPNLRAYFSEVTDLENMVFSTYQSLNIDLVENTTKIDPFIYKEGTTYRLLIKDEYDKKIEIWESTVLTSWTKVIDDITAFNIFPAKVSPSDNYKEAPHVIEFNNKTLVFVDYFVRGHMGVSLADSSLSSFQSAVPLRITDFHRHGTPYVVKDAKAKDIVTNYIASNVSTYSQKYFQIRGLTGLVDSGELINNFKPQEGFIYQLNGSENIVIESVSNDFGIKYFALNLSDASNGSITIKNVGDIKLNDTEIVFMSGADKNTLYEFIWVEASQTFRLSTKQERRSTVDRITLSTLATNNVVENLNAKDGFVYQVTGTEQITISGISSSSKAKRFYLLVASNSNAWIKIPSNASRFSVPSNGLTIQGDYGDGNVLFEFIYDRNAGVFRCTSIPTYNVLSSSKHFKTGTLDPTNNAEYVGQMYINTTTNKVYIAKTVTGSWQDWIILN